MWGGGICESCLKPKGRGPVLTGGSVLSSFHEKGELRSLGQAGQVPSQQLEQKPHPTNWPQESFRLEGPVFP